MRQVIVAAVSLPVEESSELVRSVFEDVVNRRENPVKEAPRLLISGCMMDDASLIQLVESCGVNVVIEDVCPGAKTYWHDVEETGDPLHNLAARYLDKVYCARTYRGKGEGPATRQNDLEEKFGHIKGLARDYHVDGVIIVAMRYCDTFQYDAPEIKDYLEEEGLPVLRIEDDYTVAARGQLRTRIEAFLEVLAG